LFDQQSRIKASLIYAISVQKKS